MVMRTTMGATRRSAAQHSQSLHAWFWNECRMATVYGPMVAADWSRVDGTDERTWRAAVEGEGAWSAGVDDGLRVLREGGFVESTVDAQRRLYRLKPASLQELDAWLAPFRRFWSAHLDALERHLDRMDEPPPSKGKTRRKRRGPNRERDKGETK